MLAHAYALSDPCGVHAHRSLVFSLCAQFTVIVLGCCQVTTCGGWWEKLLDATFLSDLIDQSLSAESKVVLGDH